MTCPSCGHEQPESEECARCGLVFRKMRARPEPVAVVPEPRIEPGTEPGPEPKSRSFAPVLIAVMFGVAFLVYAKQRDAQTVNAAVPVRAARSQPRARHVEPTPVTYDAPVSFPRSNDYATESPSSPPAETSQASIQPEPTAAPDSSLLETPQGGWYQGASGYAEAEREHKRRGKTMVVYFYTDWCGYCKRLNQGILSSPEASAFLDRTIKVKVNPEQGAEEKAIGSTYGVRGYPSFFVISARGSRGEISPFTRDARDQANEMTPTEFVAECRKLQ